MHLGRQASSKSASERLPLDKNSVSSVDHAFGPTGVERERIRAASARQKQCSQRQQCIWTDRRRARAHPSSFRSTKTVFPASTMHAFKQVAKKLTTELSLAERSEAHRAKRGAARSAAGAEGARRRRRPRAARGLQTKARIGPHWQRLLSWRINSLGRRESVLCTYGIF